MRHGLKALTISLLLGASLSGQALAVNIVTVGFDDLAPGNYWENFTSDGFRISPTHHADIFRTFYGPPHFTQRMGFDGAYIRDTDYLGSLPGLDRAAVYMDYFGHPFSFLSFDYWAWWGHSLTITSSRGGSITFGPFEYSVNPSELTLALEGPDWKGIKWIQFAAADCGYPCIALDNLVFSVPEPATLAIFGLGPLGLALTSRRKLN